MLSPPLSQDNTNSPPGLHAHRLRLIERATQRHCEERMSPRSNLNPEVLADDTLALAKQRTLLAGSQPVPWADDLAAWLDARLERLITERWDDAVRDYVDVMTARARGCLRRMGLPESEVSPEDVVNQAWCKARGSDFSGTTESGYYAWLLKITENAAKDAGRRKGTAKRSPNAKVARATSNSDEGLDPFDRAVKVLYQSTPSANVRREEFKIRLLAAVERMPEPDRTVAVLTLNGEGKQAIAAALGVSDQKVVGALTRILGRVRALLNDQQTGGA